MHLEEDRFVEVKIGVQYAHRELVLESAQSPAEIEELGKVLGVDKQKPSPRCGPSE